MMRKFIGIYVLSMFLSMSAFAQPGVGVIPTGGNVTSASGSAAIAIPLGVMAFTLEPRLAKEVKDFADVYKVRSQYYAGTVIDNGAIRLAVDSIQTRANSLRLDNESLAFFYPFKKRDNRTKIDVILGLIANLDVHLANLYLEPDTIYGERLNLNQNAEMTLETLHRRLDEIESDISKSRILSRLLGL